MQEMVGRLLAIAVLGHLFVLIVNFTGAAINIDYSLDLH